VVPGVSVLGRDESVEGRGVEEVGLVVSLGEAAAGGVSSRLSRLDRKSRASSALVFLFFGGIAI